MATKAPHVFSRFDLPRVEPTPLTDEILIDQEAACETDINRIMMRLGVPGMEELTMEALPEGEEVRDFSHYRDMDMPAMLREVNTAAEDYAALPANIRQHFAGLQDFVDCAVNPARLEEAVSVGIYHVDKSTGEIPTTNTLDVSVPTDTKVRKKARKKAVPKVEVDEDGEEE